MGHTQPDNPAGCFCPSLNSISCIKNPAVYKDADKSLARPTSRCILFDGENIYSSNIPPIMIINRIYETQNLLSL